MKILVTGSNGLLGQKITDAYLHQHAGEDVFELIATGLGPNRHPLQIGYTYGQLDITNPLSLREKIVEWAPDCIIHTAAMTNVDACERDVDKCHNLNVDAVRYLAEICRERDIHIVHLSTDFIFDGYNPPYSETADPNPLSVYGQSKLDAERTILQSQCSASIIRTVLVYGCLAREAKSNFVLWAKKALESNEQIRVVNDQWRMPTLAEDLALACLTAAKRKAKGIFNIAGPKVYSIFELALEVADFWRLNNELIIPISTSTLNQAAKRPMNTELILDKAHTELDFRPRSFREGLSVVDRQLQDAALR